MATAAYTIALALLVGLGVWFRVSSLGSMHYPDADEAWYGAQALNALNGRSMATRTTAGNILDPYYVGLEMLLLSAYEPSLTRLRVPSVVCGLLAIALTYVVGRRMLDRTTALIAAVLFAVLPIAIIFSRIGYYSAITPLVGLLGLYFASRGRGLAVMSTLAAGYLLHPTTIFLAPVLVAVYLARRFCDPTGNPVPRSRVLLTTIGAVVVGGLVALKLVARVPQMYTMVGHERPQGLGTLVLLLRRDRYGIGEFLTHFDRFLLGIGTDMFPIPEARLRVYDLAVWVPIAVVAAAGLVVLIRRREWDRLALVLGTVASAVGYQLFAGKLAFRPQYIYEQRYAVYLIVPTVFTLACLTRALLIGPGSPARSVARHMQQAAMLAAAALLLLCVKANWFDRYTSLGYESLWTLRTDAKDPSEQAVSIIRRHARRQRALGQPIVPEILTKHHWSHWPIRYLVGNRGDVKVVYLDELFPHQDGQRELVGERMRAGAYAVADADSPMEALVTSSFPPEALQRWDATRTGTRAISVYRLKPTWTESASDPNGAADPAARPPVAWFAPGDPDAWPWAPGS